MCLLGDCRDFYVIVVVVVGGVECFELELGRYCWLGRLLLWRMMDCRCWLDLYF